MRRGTVSSLTPRAWARLTSGSVVASSRSVTRTNRSPLRGSGTEITAWRASGHTAAAKASAAVSDTISPAILAKRFRRPRMLTQPSASVVTMSPVSCQPSVGGISSPASSR